MRIVMISFAGALFCVGCATTGGVPKGVKGGTIDVIAHRGDSAHAPENTLASFRQAISAGADWFELDCHMTSDGHIVVCHDDRLKRTGGLDMAIAELTLEEVRRVDVGSWFSSRFAGERVPTLGEALDLACEGGIGVYIEIKGAEVPQSLLANMESVASHDVPQPERLNRLVRLLDDARFRDVTLTRKVIQEVRDRKMRKRIVIQSFSPAVCAVARAEAPEMRVEFLGGYDPEHPANWDRYIRFGRAIGVAGFNVSKDNLTPERLEQLREQGETVAVWTVDDPEQICRLARMGVDAIITNNPAQTRQVLRSCR